MTSQEVATAAEELAIEPSAEGSPQLDRMVHNARLASEFLKALSHETRLLLLCLLSEKERSVTELENTLVAAPADRVATARPPAARRPCDDQTRGKDRLLQYCRR